MNSSRAWGFTLIELMVVVVVVAILAAVAYPSYQDHVRKAKRAEGKAALLRAAQVLERQYSNNNTYATDTPPSKIDLGVLFGQAGPTIFSGENPADTKSAYAITAVGCPLNACFQLTATPTGSTATPTSSFTDPICGNLTLNSTGTRSWSNSGTANTATMCRW